MSTKKVIFFQYFFRQGFGRVVYGEGVFLYNGYPKIVRILWKVLLPGL